MLTFPDNPSLAVAIFPLLVKNAVVCIGDAKICATAHIIYKTRNRLLAHIILKTRNRANVALRICGSAAVRHCSFVASWPCGFVAAWLCGFAAV